MDTIAKISLPPSTKIILRIQIIQVITRSRANHQASSSSGFTPASQPEGLPKTSRALGFRGLGVLGFRGLGFRVNSLVSRAYWLVMRVQVVFRRASLKLHPLHQEPSVGNPNLVPESPGIQILTKPLPPKRRSCKPLCTLNP